MRHLPSNFEPALKAYLKRTYYPDTRKQDFADRDFTEGDYRFFAKGVGRLSKYFTSDRGGLPKNYFNQKDLRSGYLFYFLPVNALKVAGLLNYIPAPFFQRPLKVLDLGSGPGTGMVGVWLRQFSGTGGVPHTGDPRGGPPTTASSPAKRDDAVGWGWSGAGPVGSITLVDQNRDVLRDAEGLKEALGIPGQITTRYGDLLREPLPKVVRPEPYDLILIANFLNEFPQERRRQLIDLLLRRYLAPAGRILIIEPALKRQTRELMELRDELLAEKMGYVYAPCLHQEGCPMLRHNDRDWCHVYVDWERPRWIEKVDRMLHLQKEYLKGSFLVLGNEPSPAYTNTQWRVVSGHLNSKGKSELLLCGPGGLPKLLRVTRLDKDHSSSNADFDHAQRGELVACEGKDRLVARDCFKREL